jgi:hypothetical protein
LNLCFVDAAINATPFSPNRLTGPHGSHEAETDGRISLGHVGDVPKLDQTGENL